MGGALPSSMNSRSSWFAVCGLRFVVCGSGVRFGCGGLRMYDVGAYLHGNMHAYTYVPHAYTYVPTCIRIPMLICLSVTSLLHASACLSHMDACVYVCHNGPSHMSCHIRLSHMSVIYVCHICMQAYTSVTICLSQSVTYVCHIVSHILIHAFMRAAHTLSQENPLGGNFLRSMCVCVCVCV